MLALSGYLTLSCIWSYFVFNFHLFAKLERTNNKILYTSPRNVKLGNRRHHCLQTLFLVFKFVTSKTMESFVSRTNALLVGTLT